MSDGSDRLESEIEAELQSLAPGLPVQPSEGVVLRVKAAVRHELNEAWLAGHPTPAPSPEVVHRVRETVHEELDVRDRSSGTDDDCVGRSPRRSVWSPAWASLAAAAMIGICVGIVHHVGTLEARSRPMASARAAEASLDLFVDAAEEIFAEESLTASIVADLDLLQESISQWDPVSEYDSGTLNEVVDEIDELLTKPDSDRDMSERHSMPRGAFG